MDDYFMLIVEKPNLQIDLIFFFFAFLGHPTCTDPRKAKYG